MSKEAVVNIVVKALAYAEFRKRLFSEPDAVVSGYGLTEEEMASLIGVGESAFEALASEIEERISRVTPLPVPEPVLPSWKEGIIRSELAPGDLERLLGR